MVESKPLTANSSIGTWLQHPEGGPLIRELLAQGGFDESTLAPVRDLPLQQLITLSRATSLTRTTSTASLLPRSQRSTHWQTLPASTMTSRSSTRRLMRCGTASSGST